jgi:hypothetical protein
VVLLASAPASQALPILPIPSIAPPNEVKVVWMGRSAVHHLWDEEIKI